MYLDLELPSDYKKLENPEFFFESHKDYCIIIDEIQRALHLLPILRAIIDSYRVFGKFILLGSASPALLRKSSETLTGRISYMELSGIHLTEISNRLDMTKHWVRGGFPIPLLAKDNKRATYWFQDFLRTFIENDMPMLGLNSSPQKLSRFVSMIAGSQGSLFNASTYAKSLGVSIPTVQKYKEFLEQAYLLRSLQPFFINVKKRIVKSPKVYIRDSGVLHHLLGVSVLHHLLGHISAGNSWEGYVIESIASYVQNQIQLVPYFYRTQDGAACDLVLVQGNNPIISIEIKINDNPSVKRGFLNAIDDLGTKENFIVVPNCKKKFLIKENIFVCDLGDMLKFLHGMIVG